MGKNYVENSLKRFLKRKVKITLGVVVTFLITGAVSFAGDKPEIFVKLEEQQGNYTTAKTNLAGLGAKIFETEMKDDNTHSIDLVKSDNPTEKLTITITRDAEKTTINVGTIGKEERSFSFDDKLVSDNVKTKIQNAINLKKYTIVNNDTKTIEENTAILLHTDTTGNSQMIRENSGLSKVINNGLLFNPQGTVISNTKVINNGLIFSASKNLNHGGQIVGAGIEKIELENNGLIIAAKAGQAIQRDSKNIKGYNYGVISSEDYGQIVNVGANRIDMYNYGIIEAKHEGQFFYGGTNSVLENYGTINITENNYKYGNSTIFTSGQNVGNNSNKAYNYGLIQVTDGYAMNGSGEKYNYGVIKGSENSEIFGGIGKNISKGIIIGGKQASLESYMSTNAIFDNNYNLINKDNVHEIQNEKLNSKDLKKYVVATKDKNTELSGIFEDRLITSVVTKEFQGDNTVFTVGDKELVLKGTEKEGTSLVGYFENVGGTLLKVEKDKVLTLDGNVQITAVKNQIDNKNDIYALNLEEGAALNLVGSNVKVNGIIKADKNTEIKAYASKGSVITETDGKLVISNYKDLNSEYLKEQNYTDVKIGDGINDLEIHELELNLSNTTAIDEMGELKENKIVIKDGVSITDNGSFVDNTKGVENKVKIEIENLETFANKLDKIKFGEGENTLIVNNNSTQDYYKGEINLGIGDKDTFIINAHKGENIFNYNVTNAETVELQGGTWGNWSDAKGTIKFEGNKAGNKPTLRLGNDTTMHITLNAEKDHGSDFADYVANDLKLSHAVITGTGNKSVAKYQIDETNGLDTEKLNSTKYSFGEGVSYKDSPIFNISSEEGTGVNISLKTAADLGLSGQQRVIYDAYIKQIIADGSVNKGVINKINNMNNQNDMVNLIKKTDVNGRAYYTAGSVVTKDIVNSYVSSVEEFKPRAEKGQWLAQGKYINSDTEFDGGSKVKGYDGDVTGTVGMIEYGFTDNTSYGIVYGQGDSEMDINGGGKLDGDNIYAGLYMKHRTANGIELVGNIGYVKSDMDSDLRNDFTTNYADKDGKVSIEGSTTEKGTADSSAVILSLKGRKDYKITDTVKVTANIWEQEQHLLIRKRLKTLK